MSTTLQFPTSAKQQSRRGFSKLAMAVLCAASAPMALAQDKYPSRPIRLLLGFAPGGGSDLVARLIAQSLGERLGQSIIVDNKPGAGGNIAADAAAKAPPDGYTLVLLPSGHSSNAAMKKKLPFQPVADFSWISTITTYPLVLAVVPDSPIKSFSDFISRARSEPGKYSYSSVGVGTAMHLVGEWIMSESGGTAVHVPFRGGTAPLTELLGGRVDVMIDTMTSAAPLIREKRLRALAVTSPKGESKLVGVPSVADSLPNVSYESWLGIAAPANTPQPIVDRLNREIRAVLNQAAIRKQLTDWGGTPTASSPDEFRARVEADIQRLRKVIADRHIEME